MKSFNDIKDFIETNPSPEALLKISDPLVKSLVVAIVEKENFDLKDLAHQNLKEYINFIERFFHPEINGILFFNSTNLLSEILLSQNHEFIKTYTSHHKVSNYELFNIFKNLNFDLSISYDVKQKALSLNPQLINFKYLLEPIHIQQSDEFSLLENVFETLPLELSLHSGGFVVNLKHSRTLIPDRDSILNKFNLAVSRFTSSPASKYMGIALALGMAFMGEANAGSSDVSEYINAVNNSLSQMQGDLPVGCEFGAKVISKNSLGMVYEVQLGDYVVNTKFTKLGNLSETLDQTVYKLKEAKGCGLSKVDVNEMSQKITKMVAKLWSR